MSIVKGTTARTSSSTLESAKSFRKVFVSWVAVLARILSFGFLVWMLVWIIATSSAASPRILPHMFYTILVTLLGTVHLAMISLLPLCTRSCFIPLLRIHVQIQLFVRREEVCSSLSALPLRGLTRLPVLSATVVAMPAPAYVAELHNWARATLSENTRSAFLALHARGFLLLVAR